MSLAYELDVSGSGTSINPLRLDQPSLAVDPVDGSVYVAATDEDGRQVIDRFDGSTGLFLDFFDGSSGSPDGGFGCVADEVGGGWFAVGCMCLILVSTARVVLIGSVLVVGLRCRSMLRRVVGRRRRWRSIRSRMRCMWLHAGPVGLQVTHFTAGGDGVVYTFDASRLGGVRGMAVSGAGTVYMSDVDAAVCAAVYAV